MRRMYVDVMMSSLHLFRFEDNGRVFCEGENDVLEFYKEEPLRADTRLQVKAKHKTKTKDIILKGQRQLQGGATWQSQ